MSQAAGQCTAQRIALLASVQRSVLLLSCFGPPCTCLNPARPAPLPPLAIHPQGKIDACSAYDPCDLFSGEPARLRSALAALLEQPQNNLLLFVDGQRQELAGQQRRQRRQVQQQQDQAPQSQTEEQPQPQPQGAAPLEDLLGGLLPLPPRQRRSAVAELLAAVLEAEGVLPRLLQAQQQCPFDVEGTYRLYCQLAGSQPEEAAAGAEDGDDSSGEGGSSGSSDSSAAHAAAVAQLLALPTADAQAVLRSYVVSATAKDCAVMVALQRLDGPPEAIAGQAGSAREAAGVAAAGMAAGSEAASNGQGAAVQQASPEQQQWWDMPPACIFLPAHSGEQEVGGGIGRQADASGGGSSGAWFRYRLCFVDLDLKPLVGVSAVGGWLAGAVGVKQGLLLVRKGAHKRSLRGWPAGKRWRLVACAVCFSFAWLTLRCPTQSCIAHHAVHDLPRNPFRVHPLTRRRPRSPPMPTLIGASLRRPSATCARRAVYHRQCSANTACNALPRDALMLCKAGCSGEQAGWGGSACGGGWWGGLDRRGADTSLQ